MAEASAPGSSPPWVGSLVHKSALIPQTSKMLAAEDHERGRTVVLVLDEARLLGIDQLEELRLLTNADMDSHSPFA